MALKSWMPAPSAGMTSVREARIPRFQGVAEPNPIRLSNF
jgi:hypothetical protein